jgi:hypothetical protein
MCATALAKNKLFKKQTTNQVKTNYNQHQSTVVLLYGSPIGTPHQSRTCGTQTIYFSSNPMARIPDGADLQSVLTSDGIRWRGFAIRAKRWRRFAIRANRANFQ